MFFSCAIATFPGEFVDGGVEYADEGTTVKDWRKPGDSYLSSSKGWLFGDLTPGKARKRLIPFSRALDLPDNTTLIDLDKFDKIRNRHKQNDDTLEPWETGRTHDLRERNLRGGMFNRSDLRNIDLFAARLQGASLLGARLQGASLFAASLQGASLVNTDFRGASLDRAGLQGASLDRASLQGASLYGASLQGASLVNTDFRGASLNGTLLWRAYGGSLWRTYSEAHAPHAVSSVLALINAPQLKALTTEEIADVNTEALLGVVSKDAMERIKKKLARLSVRDTDVQNNLPETYWAHLTGKLTEEEYQKDLAGRLISLACDEFDAPYVTQGLIKISIYITQYRIEAITQSRLEAIGPTHLPHVAKTLLDTAEGRTADCPGAVGLDTDSIARLRMWATETENNVKSAGK